VPKQLRKRRLSLGFTLRSLAKRADLSESALSMLEADKRVPSSASLRTIMDVLCVDDPSALGYQIVPTEKVVRIDNQP